MSSENKTATSLDLEKVENVLNKIIKCVNTGKLSIREIIILYGNLGYHFGASIAGFKDKGPGIEDLKKAYYSSPTVDIGLMLQGLMITGWEEDFIKSPKISNLVEYINKKEQSSDNKT